MPQLTLSFLRKDPQVLGTETVYYERIKAMLAIGNAAQVLQDCLVDTGSVLSVFPEKQWQRFRGDITWLYRPGDPGRFPDWLVKVTGLGAHSIPCRIGKVKIRIIELPSRRVSPQVEILAKFPHDGGAFSQILLGIGGKAFSNWKLAFDYSNQAALLDY
jgi:hypothetical protein